jgi:hypothetical protein
MAVVRGPEGVAWAGLWKRVRKIRKATTIISMAATGAVLTAVRRLDRDLRRV